jgi:hypothetical protein
MSDHPDPVIAALPPLVPIKRVREVLGGSSRATIYRYIQRGILEAAGGASRPGSRTLITKQSIERFAQPKVKP